MLRFLHCVSVHSVEFPSLCTQCWVSITSVYSVAFPSLCQCIQCWVSITVSLYTMFSFHHCVIVYSVEFPSLCRCIQCWVSLTVSLYTVFSFHHCVHNVSFPYSVGGDSRLCHTELSHTLSSWLLFLWVWWSSSLLHFPCMPAYECCVEFLLHVCVWRLCWVSFAGFSSCKCDAQIV